jgi:hypothetical protein
MFKTSFFGDLFEAVKKGIKFIFRIAIKVGCPSYSFVFDN